MENWTKDIITPEEANTLHKLFLARVARHPEQIAYRYFDNQTRTWREYTWQQSHKNVISWRKALLKTGLQPGDCVGLMLRNCPEWIFCEQACKAEGLISVPLYPNDRPDNVSFIVNEAEIKLVLIENDLQAEIIKTAEQDFDHPISVIHLENLAKLPQKSQNHLASQWLKGAEDNEDKEPFEPDPNQLATIVYTSGTTGKPKGVMLSHTNILADAFAGISAVTVYREDLFLSFLPLSHTLERTVGYYIPMMTGATVAFCRSVPQLAEDLLEIRPTIIISVPRIYERVYGKIQDQLETKSPVARKLFNLTQKVGWRRFLYEQSRASFSLSFLLWPLLQKIVAQKILDKLGGRLRFSISGGAPLPEPVSRLFIAFGLKVLQGYGLTESSPVISVNTLESNFPKSIGKALPGIKVRVDENKELQTKSECVMLGYWKNEEKTKETFTEDGWLRTGDLAEIINDHIYITGRLKEILVLSNGEKVPPVDMEIALSLNPLFEQAMVIGEGKPYLCAIIVLEQEHWKKYAKQIGVSPDESSIHSPEVKIKINKQVAECLREFPGYAQIRQITLSLETWTDANYLLTASLKLRREVLMEKFKDEIDQMYHGH